MALDEVLLHHSGGPWLRLYKWREETISIGYFMAQETVDFEGKPWVRRWTGGGMVMHGTPHETTFSLGFPSNHTESGVRISNSYRLIHQQVQLTLNTMGISCYLEPETSSEDSIGGCFNNPVASDIINRSDGLKIVGGAQRRNQRGLLHQGSVQVPSLSQEFGSKLASALGQNVESRAIGESLEEAAHKLVCTKYNTPAWKMLR